MSKDFKSGLDIINEKVEDRIVTWIKKSNKAEAQLTTANEQIASLTAALNEKDKAIGLAKSMILGGESMTSTAEAFLASALATNKDLAAPDAEVEEKPCCAMPDTIYCCKNMNPADKPKCGTCGGSEVTCITLGGICEANGGPGSSWCLKECSLRRKMEQCPDCTPTGGEEKGTDGK